MAFFALVSSRGEAPVLVFAIVAFSQVCSGLIDLPLSSYSCLGRTASDNLICSGQKAVFVPLVTFTSLPALPADVAAHISKLCGRKGWELRTKIEHCKDSLDSRQYLLRDRCLRQDLHHVIASNVKLNKSPTNITSLPTIFPCHLQHLLSCDILWAVTVMSVVLANGTSLCAAFLARCLLAGNVDRRNERGAQLLGTVGTIRGLRFNVFLFEGMN